MSGHCWKGFQGQRSKVKVTARPDVLFFAAEAYISTVWRRSWLVDFKYLAVTVVPILCCVPVFECWGRSWPGCPGGQKSQQRSVRTPAACDSAKPVPVECWSSFFLSNCKSRRKFPVLWNRTEERRQLPQQLPNLPVCGLLSFHSLESRLYCVTQPGCGFGGGTWTPVRWFHGRGVDGTSQI